MTSATTTGPYRRMHVVAALFAAALVAGVLAVAAPAVAQPAVAKADPAVAAALRRIGGNTHSAADLALIRSRPELARVVIDPRRTTTSVSTDPAMKVRGSDAAQDWCAAYWVDRTYYSTLGWVLFTWRHYVEGCIDGFITTRWKSRLDFLTQADGTVVFNGLVTDWATGPGGWTMTSMRQRYIQQCLLTYGCYANYYPWSRISVNANGTWTWAAG